MLGGLILSNGITNANFYLMVEIIFIFDSNCFLRDESGITVQRDNNPLQPGNYYMLPSGSVTVTDEVPLVRTASLQSGICVAGFRDAVRERDRRCVITGESVPYNFWTGFEAAHVFPLAYEGH